MDRVVAELIAQAALIAAEREAGTSIGVFMSVPKSIPLKPAGKHKDDPHVTILFIGEVSPEHIGALINTVQSVVAGHPPLEMKLDDEVTYFEPTESSDGQRVAKLGVNAEGLKDLHEEIWEKVEAVGIEVDHSFPEFKPHVTLDYLEPGTEYDSDAPLGASWTAGNMEVWGWGDPIEIPFAVEVTAGSTHWSEKVKQAPATFRSDLVSLMWDSTDNARESVEENLRDLVHEDHASFWEDVADEFYYSLEDKAHEDLFTKAFRAKKLEKPGAIEKITKRAPEEMRKELHTIFRTTIAQEKKRIDDAIKQNPETHPAYDGWWFATFEMMIPEELGEHAEEAAEWVRKNVARLVGK